MIRTVTLNTGFDELFHVSAIEFGGVGEVLSYGCKPSGKGINASRVIRALGMDVTTYGWVGEADESTMDEMLQAEGMNPSLIRIPGSTRRNLTLVVSSENRPAAHFRGEGFREGTEEALGELADRLAKDASESDVVSLHGSMPMGLPPDGWALIARAAASKGARLFIDVYGQALERVLRAVPAIGCKPNEDEMRELPGARDGDALEGARSALLFMRRCGVATPMVSLGSRGVLFAVEDRLLRAECEATLARIVVGAGDAFVGGFLAAVAGGAGSTELAIRTAVAVATAHVEGVEDRDLPGRTAELTGAVRVQSIGPLSV